MILKIVGALLVLVGATVFIWGLESGFFSRRSMLNLTSDMIVCGEYIALGFVALLIKPVDRQLT